MKIAPLHPWNVSPAEAIRIQSRLRKRILCQRDVEDVCSVAGVDVGVKGDMARAAVVVLSYPDLQPLAQSVAEQPVPFPYVPGLLSFREMPSILSAFERLSTEPDLIIVDGQGIAHPRRLGIASHLGVWLDKPTIGCAKSRLWGRHKEPGMQRGAYAYLYDGEEVIGAALRTKDRTRVVYVSVGHRMDLRSAIEVVLRCCRGYRLPQMTRLAHQVAGGRSVVMESSAQTSLFLRVNNESRTESGARPLSEDRP